MTPDITSKYIYIYITISSNFLFEKNINNLSIKLFDVVIQYMKYDKILIAIRYNSRTAPR